ncbi:MAG TPA: metallophosphoesterase [Gemmatimonadales bacterium]|nr:metallophosphoesterase [Gemmatimonadales bacterium]
MNAVLQVGVLLLFALAVFGSAWYIAFRLRMTFGLQRRWLLRVLVTAALVGSFVLMVPATKSVDVVAGMSYVLGGYLFAGYVFLTLAFVFLHFIERAWHIPKARVGAAALLLAAGATLVGGMWANRFSVVETEIALPGLGRDVVAMQLSDIHLGHHRGRKYLEKIVAETNQREPDIVLITGDLIDSEAAFLPGELEPLARFSAPVYYVGGNHEMYVDAERTFASVKKYGVTILRNQVVETHGFQLVGLDYMNADEDAFDLHPSDDSRTIKSVLASLHLKDGMPSVLLHHSPTGAQHAAANGIDLMIAGHTHGGQFFPGTLVATAIFPFTHGLYHRGPLQVFVSQGAGTYMSRVRLGTSNELNILQLRAKR